MTAVQRGYILYFLVLKAIMLGTGDDLAVGSVVKSVWVTFFLARRKGAQNIGVIERGVFYFWL